MGGVGRSRESESEIEKIKGRRQRGSGQRGWRASLRVI